MISKRGDGKRILVAYVPQSRFVIIIVVFELIFNLSQRWLTLIPYVYAEHCTELFIKIIKVCLHIILAVVLYPCVFDADYRVLKELHDTGETSFYQSVILLKQFSQRLMVFLPSVLCH